MEQAAIYKSVKPTSPRNTNKLNLQGAWKAWTDLDGEITSEREVAGSLGEEVPTGSVGRAGALGASR